MIVLAAGGSRRLGRPKQLLRLRSETLLARTLRLARTIDPDQLIVVIGSQRLRLRRTLRGQNGPVTPVDHGRWQEGLASSLQRGLGAVRHDCAAAMLLLVDQPLLERGDLRRLVSRWRRKPRQAVAAVYAGRAGAPAILPRRWFRALRSLQGDAGARSLLRRLDGLTQVSMPRAEFDVDTSEDAAKLLN